MSLRKGDILSPYPILTPTNPAELPCQLFSWCKCRKPGKTQRQPGMGLGYSRVGLYQSCSLPICPFFWPPQSRNVPSLFHHHHPHTLAPAMWLLEAIWQPSSEFWTSSASSWGVTNFLSGTFATLWASAERTVLSPAVLWIASFYSASPYFILHLCHKLTQWPQSIYPSAATTVWEK